jgi:hypothetical protein
MAEMKYIMIEWKERQIPILFVKPIPHIDMFEAIMKQLPEMHDAKIYSAGSLILDVETVFGHSSTLGVKHNSADKHIINTINYLHGVGLK